MRKSSLVSRDIAKERLRIILDQEHHSLDEETMDKIRHEVGKLITRYVEIAPENIEVKVILKDYKKKL